TTKDGRIFIADQTGYIRGWKNRRLQQRPVLDLSERVDDYWERGLIGLTFHPDFPQTPQLFVVYVAKEPWPHHVISRFTMIGDQADPESEFVLLRGDDQTKLGGKVPHGHQGGPIRFGPDGKIYVGIGEQTARQPSQSLKSLLGKILRINPDGSIPTDNPFYQQATGKYRAIWATGIRNPFGMAFDPDSERLFISDVGQSKFEEINHIKRGANYGWPHAEGPLKNPKFTNPIHAYPPAFGRSIVGAGFYPRDDPFPPKWRGKFFFADWAANWVKAIDPDNPARAIYFAKGLNKPATIEIAHDGSLLVLNRGTIWRDGKKWKSDSGSLVRINYRPDAEDSHWHLHPKTLNANGFFDSLAPFHPIREFVEFKINLEPWKPGVTTRRWILCPKHQHLEIDGGGEFRFPKGTIVIQHHSVAKTGRPFETHLLEFHDARRARTTAYRWQADLTNATLIEDSKLIQLPEDSQHRWYSPGAEQDLDLDSVVIGFNLPVSPRQVNREQQLSAWYRRGWLKEPIKNLPGLAAIDDETAPLAYRVRSYLDVNCATCHRPGGPSRGNFDTRFNTPLRQQGLIRGQPVVSDMGISGAQIVVPGQPDKSLLLQRMTHPDIFRMPPVALNPDPSPIVPLLRQWIEGL
ncbi:MAG: PQQ-dependent sugar dehydrogenase, partial [Limisphaerales bacterium]